MASFLFNRRQPASSSGFGSSGFDSYSTAEEVTCGIDGSHLTAIITGASSGIGAETARVLAMRGVQLVIAVRNVVAGEKVKQAIVNDNKNARVHVLELELSSMQSVREFCKNFKSLNIPLNILINNAGTMGCPFQLSEDGVELQFATNHLGPFLLTNLLLPTMKTCAKTSNIEGRILFVSSEAHRLIPYIWESQFDTTLNEGKSYISFRAYGQSKFANILCANELGRRLQDEGANVTANSLHPGLVITNLIQNNHFLVSAAQFEKWASFLLKTIPQGAATQCFLALHPSVKGVSGKYFKNCNFGTRTSYSKDPERAIQLWEFCEKLISCENHEQI